VIATQATKAFTPQVLREYALIADGERGALVGPHGEVAWLCVPRWHSDAVFAALVGGDSGYAVTPDSRFVWGGYYEPGTLIWHGRWVTGDGIVECADALAAPADRHRAVLLRRLTARDAPARVEVLLDPRDGFGGPGPRALLRDDEGRWTGRLGDYYLRWSGDTGTARVRRGPGGCQLALTLTVRPGEPRDLVLELSDRPLPAPAAGPGSLWRATRAHWERAVPPLRQVTGTRDARHAVAVMTGLTSADGGMAAAATTSLPERADTGRNYDYRYAWIRDQCYAGQAAAAAGVPHLLDAATRFVTARLHADGPRLAPAYTVAGDPLPPPGRLGLPGYPGGYDLVGNRARDQFQLDTFGESLLLLAAAARAGRLGADGWQAAAIAASAIAGRWREPDAGIWELSGESWTHSRLCCVAGLRAAAAARGAPAGPGEPARAWQELADAILADTAARAVHPSGRWQRSPADPGLDGALLLPPLRGAVPAADPRSVAPLRGYVGELTEDGYAYRFRHDSQPLGQAEGAFLLCGFLLALAHHQQGDEVAAMRWFERNRAACGPPGLYAEEYDVTQRQLRGNLPQAFVHALLLESAARLAGPWEDKELT
jgi:hypothetical protein